MISDIELQQKKEVLAAFYCGANALEKNGYGDKVLQLFRIFFDLESILSEP